MNIEFAPKLLEKDIRDEIRKIRESKLAKTLEKPQSRTGSEYDDTVTESSSTEILTDYTILDKKYLLQFLFFLYDYESSFLVYVLEYI